jgi:lysophospholipase L1-like esterase
MPRINSLALAVCLVVLSPQFSLAGTDHWVGSWSTAAQTETDHPALVPATTYRNNIHISVGGNTWRVRLTNEIGVAPLQIGAASVGLDAGSGAVVAGTMQSLTFNGKTSITIPIGSVAVSDAFTMDVPSFSNLAVSIYVPQQTIVLSYHRLAVSSNYTAPGNQVRAAYLDDAQLVTSWYFLKGVDVKLNNGQSIVALGDSITDGKAAKQDQNGRWPDVLTSRLATGGSTPLSVLNEGIGGNRILNYDLGKQSVLARLDRDGLAESGAKYLILLIGYNDINISLHPATPSDVVTAAEIEWAMTQVVVRAHGSGFLVYGATLTPASLLPPAGQAMRTAVNEWIRTSGTFDGIIDFDAAVRDPANPSAYLETYDSGDHVHPNDRGYAAMANSIDLSLFQ